VDKIINNNKNKQKNKRDARESNAPRVANRIGLVCFALTVLAWAASLPLHCARLAAWVAVVAWGAGGLFGVFLALVTRTRKPILIYLLLGLAALTLWPLFQSWPYADAWDVIAWPGAPGFVQQYFTLLRPIGFLLGLPFPFACLGQHSPDPLPAIAQNSDENAETEA
jgi:hypothetical protein